MFRSLQSGFILGLFVLLSCQLCAQNGARLSFERYESIKEEVLLVALYEEDSLYNDIIRTNIEKYWKITPFKFVPEQDLIKLASEDEYAMLVRDNSQKIRGRGRLIQRNHLSIFPSGRGGDWANYGGHFAISQFHLSKVEQTQDIAYKLPGLLQVMHHYMSFLDTVKFIDEDYFPPLLDQWQNQYNQDLSKKTLYLTKEDLGKDLSIEKVRKAYPYPVELVSTDSIGKMIDQQQTGTAWFHIDPRKKELWAIDSESGHILYHAKTDDYGSLTIKDWKAMSKAVEAQNEEDTKPIDDAILRVNKLFGKLR